MRQHDPDILLEAFDSFLEEDKMIAESLGYNFSTASDTDGINLYLDIVSNYPDMPSLDINILYRSDNSYEFCVEVEFPDLKFDGSQQMSDIIEEWASVSNLVDDLTNLKFDPELWID